MSSVAVMLGELPVRPIEVLAGALMLSADVQVWVTCGSGGLGVWKSESGFAKTTEYGRARDGGWEVKCARDVLILVRRSPPLEKVAR